MAFNAGIIGASGFTGAELLRLLAGHPALDVAVATADTQAGIPAAALYPLARRRLSGPAALLVRPASADDVARVDGLDVVFLGLPHQASMALAPQLVGRVGCVVDLSAAYRLKDASLYPRWYGFEHDQPELLAEAVYGLPELPPRGPRAAARLVATPGCYVTDGDAGPRAAARRRARSSAPGSSSTPLAASRAPGGPPKADTTFCAVDEDFTAYGLLDHRHTPEIEQKLDAQVLFTPHLAPMNRGILATCYARPAAGTTLSTATLLDAAPRSLRRRAVRRRHRRVAVDQGHPRLQRRPRHRPLRRAHRHRRWPSPPSTTSPRARPAAPSRRPTSPSVSTRPPASPASAWPRDRHRTPSTTSRPRSWSRRCRTSAASPARWSSSSTAATPSPGPPITTPSTCSPRTSC